jgi:plastocyanin
MYMKETHVFRLRRWGLCATALLVGAVALGCGKKEDEMRRPTLQAPQAGAPAGAAAGATGTASVSGKVTFAGTAPAPKTLKVSADEFCVKAHAGAVKSEEVVVNSDGSLRNAIVYVKTGISGSYTPAAGAARLDQVGCLYTPHVLAVQAGQPLEIHNSDNTTHNVHTQSTVNAPFNQGMPPNIPPIQKSFDQPEASPVRFKCDVHPWMSAYVGVFSHPFFAVTSDGGTFTIKNLPAGKYTVAAWQETLGEKTAEIEVTDGQAATLDFSFGG